MDRSAIRVPYVALPLRAARVKKELMAAIEKVVDHGVYILGPEMEDFEHRFAHYCGTRYAVGVGDGTSALILTLKGLGVGPGDEVIAPTYTWVATINAVVTLGAVPVFVDIDESLTMDPRAVEAAITDATMAIVPVHMRGAAADIAPILAIAERRGLAVLEDAAQAVGGLYHGKRLGTFGKFGAFSLQYHKTITTGEGGMVVTRDPEIAARMRVMRLHGMSRDAFNRFTAEVPSWYYEVVAPGYKYNLTDIAAALGIHQLKRAREFQARRAEIAAAYAEALRGLPLVLAPEAAPGDLHAWHLYAVRLDDAAPVARDAFIERLYADGIGCSVHYIPLHLQPYWRERYGLVPAAFPHSQRAFKTMLSLPLYTRMTDADVQRVIAAVRAALG